MVNTLKHGIRTAPFWFVLALASGVASLLIFLFRGDLLWLEYQPATLGEVYAQPPMVGPRITGFRNDDGALTVKIEKIGECSGWRVTGPDGGTVGQDSAYPVLKLQAGRHLYRIAPAHCRVQPAISGLRFDVAYTPKGVAPGALADRDLINLYNAPLELTRRAGADFGRWIPPLGDYPADEIARADAFLKRIGVKDTMTSLEKLTAVTAGLLAQAKPGQPPAGFDAMTPMQVLESALGNGIPVFCRQRALMKSFLLNVAGLPTRIVWTGRTIDGVLMGSHAFTESYVLEQGRWAYSDMSHRLPFLRGKDGRVLSALDMQILTSTGALDGPELDWSSLLPKGSPDQGLLKSLDGVFSRNAILQFWGAHDRFAQQINPTGLRKLTYRLRRYLFEPTLYIGFERGYSLHWLRLALLVLSGASATVWLALSVLRRGRRGK
jgi:hypothetical protein